MCTSDDKTSQTKPIVRMIVFPIADRYIKSDSISTPITGVVAIL